jgi:hypothetical protein
MADTGVRYRCFGRLVLHEITGFASICIGHSTVAGGILDRLIQNRIWKHGDSMLKIVPSRSAWVVLRTKMRIGG